MIQRGYKYLFTPYQKDDALAELVAIVDNAKAKIRMEIYGYTLQPLTDALIRAAKRGVDVKALFDHTQESGPAAVAQLKQLWGIVPFLVGTSPEHGQIRHSKNLTADGMYTETGSLNYSASAFLQNNTVCILTDPDVAAQIEADFDAGWAWVAEHDARYQWVSADGPATPTPAPLPPR
jgi:phosphatidylserine/phosphatidylglycerophosphate/cardiolipin synthase-like enzyme